jgi:hypothetical protein
MAADKCASAAAAAAAAHLAASWAHKHNWQMAIHFCDVLWDIAEATSCWRISWLMLWPYNSSLLGLCSNVSLQKALLQVLLQLRCKFSQQLLLPQSKNLYSCYCGR